MNLLLLIGSTVALALLVVHSWRTRGRAVTLAFFVSATAFGVLRGNAIYYLCQFLGEGNAAALQPYLSPEGLLPPIGHDSAQVALGWVFAMYLAWTISELILRRVKGDSPLNGTKGTVPFYSRVFMIGGLASLFMLAICLCMETAAVTVGWWYWWALPTGTALFGRVNVPAMEGWFSVVPDFLIPFLVIVCSATRHTRLKWLWLLAFPLHLAGHMMYRWVPMAYLTYNAMELLVVALMMFHPLRMARGEIRESEGLRLEAWGLRYRKTRFRAHCCRTSSLTPSSLKPAVFLAAALAIFFGIVLIALIVAGAGMAKVLTVMPMLMLCLLAWRRLPVKAVVVVSLVGLAGWFWQGPRALWTLAPVAAFAFLALLDRTEKGVRPLYTCESYRRNSNIDNRLRPQKRGLTPFSVLRWVPPATVVALAALCSVLFEIDKGRAPLYEQAWEQGDRAWFAEQSESRADAAYSRADGLRPRELMSFYLAVRDMMNIDDLAVRYVMNVNRADDASAARLLERRIPRFVRELEEIVRRDDEYVSARQDLARFYLLEGRVADARAQYASMRRLRPKDRDILVMLGYLLLREGKTDEARRVCEEALRLKDPPVEAMVNLGVIRLADGKGDEARSLWARALAKDPRHPIARLNLRRLESDRAPRTVDARYLARTKTGVQLAPRVCNLAEFGRGYLRDDRIRLYAEAAQLDPTFVAPHVRLARTHLEGGTPAEAERALWHARRAVDLAPEAVAEAAAAVALARKSGGDRDLAIALARKSNAEDDVAESLLVLGGALAATGDRAGARTVLEEGRSRVPARTVPQFDALLEYLRSSPR